MFEFFTNKIYLTIASEATEVYYCVFNIQGDKLTFYEIGSEVIYKAIAKVGGLINCNRIVKIYCDPSASELIKEIKKDRKVNRFEGVRKEIGNALISPLVQASQILYGQSKVEFEKSSVERTFKKYQSVIDPKNLHAKQKVILMAISIFKRQPNLGFRQVVPSEHIFL